MKSYRGMRIYECERARGEHRGRWIIQTYHAPTGMRNSDDLCPHAGTLKEAREIIDEMIYERALATASSS